ncbi:nuclear envelope integral membrane protein 2 [Ctenodactylus gundi]
MRPPPGPWALVLCLPALAGRAGAGRGEDAALSGNALGPGARRPRGPLLGRQGCGSAPRHAPGRPPGGGCVDPASPRGFGGQWRRICPRPRLSVLKCRYLLCHGELSVLVSRSTCVLGVCHVLGGVNSTPAASSMAVLAMETPPRAGIVVSGCTVLEEMDFIKTSGSNCYCYNQHSQVEWTYIWSTLKVKISSPDLLSIVYITEKHNCQYPETVLSVIKCAIHNFWTPEESNETTVIISPYKETVCFSVKPVRRMFVYTVRVNRNIVDFKLLLMSVAGVVLFFYAKTLSQSPIFYYSSGAVLGILMTSVFVLLLVKRYIPKYSTFWALMVGSWFASVYVVCQLTEDLKWLWYGNRMYVLGYVFVVGFLSFAACYKHGPLVDAQSRSLLKWTLQCLSLVLIYVGVAVPQLSYTVMVLLLSCQSLHYPLKALSYMRWRVKEWLTSGRLVVKYLTEDEYREQADVETSRALEELRQACRRPDFPTWLAVSKLQAPKKFADFVLGASHLSPEEVSLHEAQYGLGGTFLEEQLFNLPTEGLPGS